MRFKVLPGICIIALPYVLVIFLYVAFRHFIPGVSFAAHKDGLGAALASYAGTMIAILIAAMTFLIGSKSRKINKVREYGYMTSVVIVYALNFVELGILFFAGVLLISNINGYLLPTLAIGIAAASFIHICILVIQLYNLTRE
ncbi:TPA: biopolymer transporter ExbB [Yersinia enterocolitica]|nr:biopolymer transporter ExbB [Yersinia enterocolitica]EKN3982628.1 biopolymer transporter ExbB [Yersinia enterocolitica]EKN4826789.1 biopolymer transporter ExbB [Yersinia enterocolitica]EKN5157515.1 biopolymer transporter ExbB [Yersinia enterocolitica]HDL7179852.1 biopolymer transporter ExbB [Yersinia enterocolitica]